MIVGDEALAKRLEQFEASFGAACTAVMPGGASLTTAGGIAIFGGPRSPLTQAISLAIGEPIHESALEGIEEFYRIRGAPCIIHVTPWTDSSLTNALAARGYAIVEYQNVFVRPLTDDDRVVAANESIRIERIDPADSALWARIAGEGFASEEMPAADMTAMMEPVARAAGAHCYVAYLDGEPAGSATIAISEEARVAGLYGASTLPRFRNRGVQGALLARRLGDARAAGCDLALVTTIPGSPSHRNVARRGFELVYAKIAMKRVFG
ncbi:MAG TPA: GNAT family N-acetyltransferase [Thermoanaerobaculia bacterium]|nr:GNAT family N-acetyltransferase [Thermoanaerobaculia bacterium]